jgi:hypothetical protein
MIWVEILSRSHFVLARHRCAGPEIRIGRGYDNDVVVDDPYVDPHHVRIVRSSTDGLVAEDLGSVNGLYSNQSPQRVERLAVDGNLLIGIGRTYLRIREASHAVAPARMVEPAARSAPMLVVLGAATLGITALFQWLSETSEPKPSDYLLLLTLLCGAVLAWTGGWATLSRVFSGQAGFERNLLIALWGALLLELGAEAAGIATFALSWSAPATYSYAGAWALLAVICFLHMREMSASRLRLKGGVIAALAVVAIAMQTLLQLERRTDILSADRTSEARAHLPPALRLVPLRSEADFFAGAVQLKAGLDNDRAQ